MLGTRRRFGNALHAVIAAYEEREPSLEFAFEILEDVSDGLTVADIEEARQILRWRHAVRAAREGRTLFVEHPLHCVVEGHRLEVRLDRLDDLHGRLRLLEYKAGKSVDLKIVRAQMMIQAFAVWSVFGQVPEFWDVELLHKRQISRLDPERDPETLRCFTARLAAGILEGRHDPDPADPAFCKRCPARTYCPRVTERPRPFSRAPREVAIQRVLF